MFLIGGGGVFGCGGGGPGVGGGSSGSGGGGGSGGASGALMPTLCCLSEAANSPTKTIGSVSRQ